MPTSLRHCFAKPALLACAFTLAACTPKYDWREVRGTDAPFVVVLPGKPATYSRPVNLGGVQVTMTMTAAEVDAVTFAVGSAELPDAGQAVTAIAAMKTAMVSNIGGVIKSEKSTSAMSSSGNGGSALTSIDIEALGAPAPDSGGEPRLLVARFVASGKRAYQAIVVGREKSVTPEAIDTFFTSFKVN